jgi:hypothetical protein
MALLENNVRRILSYSYLMERNLKLFCSTKITQIHVTITLKMILKKDRIFKAIQLLISMLK